MSGDNKTRIMEYLNGNGYKGEFDQDGDIKFKYEGTTCYIENDKEYYRLFRIYVADSEDLSHKGTTARNVVNSKLRAVCVYTANEKTLFIECGAFYSTVEEFLKHFERMETIIAQASRLYVESIKEIK